MSRLKIPLPDARERQARREHHFDEYETGVDRVGPQFDREEDEKDAATVFAAGVAAYYPRDDE